MQGSLSSIKDNKESTYYEQAKIPKILECDHLNTSHEELIEFNRPVNDLKSP